MSHCNFGVKADRILAVCAHLQGVGQCCTVDGASMFFTYFGGRHSLLDLSRITQAQFIHAAYLLHFHSRLFIYNCTEIIQCHLNEGSDEVKVE